jgi:hypothetical protein
MTENYGMINYRYDLEFLTDMPGFLNFMEIQLLLNNNYD